MRFLRYLIESLKGTSERALLIRFLAVGGGFTVLYSLGATVLTVTFSLQPAISSTVSYIACLLPSYLMQKSVAFRSPNKHAYSLPRYLFLQFFLLASGSALSWMLITRLAWNPLVSFLFIGPFVAGFSFFAQRYWTFLEQT